MKSHEFFLLFLKLGEVRRSRNMKTKFCWDASQLRYETSQQKTEKTEISPKVAGLTPQSRYMTESLLQSQSLKNNDNKDNDPQNALNMSWNCPNWEQLRAVVYSVNLYHHIHITQHKKALVRVTIKISGCLRWFVNKSNFADVP